MMLTSKNDSSAMMLNAVTEVLGELVAEVVIPTLSWQVRDGDIRRHGERTDKVTTTLVCSTPTHLSRAEASQLWTICNKPSL